MRESTKIPATTNLTNVHQPYQSSALWPQLGGAPTPTCMYSSRRLSCTQLLLRCLPPSPQLLSVSLARPPSLSSSRMRPAARYCVLYPSNVRLCSGLSLRSPALPARAQKILTPAGGFCNLQASFWNARRRDGGCWTCT